MAADGKHGVGRALDVLSVYDRLGCDILGLQETRRGHSAFSQAGYLVYRSGECGDENGGKKGQAGVGLAVRTSITRAARPLVSTLVSAYVVTAVVCILYRASSVYSTCMITSTTHTVGCRRGNQEESRE